MRRLTKHISACMIAGIVALLPIGGSIFTLVYLEWTLSETYLAEQPWYFPGLGILTALLAIYLVGLFVTTFIGKLIWKLIDRLLESLPLLGQLYATLKQVLGYGQGKGALFHRVVLVPNRAANAHELGLVTLESTDSAGNPQLAVFVPGSPNPGAGRLLLLPASAVTPTSIPVSDALKALVAVGATPLTPPPASPPTSLISPPTSHAASHESNTPL